MTLDLRLTRTTPRSAQRPSTISAGFLKPTRLAWSAASTPTWPSALTFREWMASRQLSQISALTLIQDARTWPVIPDRYAVAVNHQQRAA